ncbi:hypothetical protein D5274_04475 [bacterium 1XD42-94]|nr:hypothetical protein [bacterium 1XD42-76]NBK04427.1 hypothetical protein [bacterium 1XD42-94]
MVKNDFFPKNFYSCANFSPVRSLLHKIRPENSFFDAKTVYQPEKGRGSSCRSAPASFLMAHKQNSGYPLCLLFRNPPPALFYYAGTGMSIE